MNIKLKIYGLISLTRKQYVYSQTGSFAIGLALWLWNVYGNFNELLFGFGTPLLIFVSIADVVETYVVLRKFKKLNA